MAGRTWCGTTEHSCRDFYTIPRCLGPTQGVKHGQQLERVQGQSGRDLEVECGGGMVRSRLAGEQKSKVRESSLLGQRLPSCEGWKRSINRAKHFSVDPGI